MRPSPSSHILTPDEGKRAISGVSIDRPNDSPKSHTLCLMFFLGQHKVVQVQVVDSSWYIWCVFKENSKYLDCGYIFAKRFSLVQGHITSLRLPRSGLLLEKWWLFLAPGMKQAKSIKQKYQQLCSTRKKSRTFEHHEFTMSHRNRAARTGKKIIFNNLFSSS